MDSVPENIYDLFDRPPSIEVDPNVDLSGLVTRLYGDLNCQRELDRIEKWVRAYYPKVSLIVFRNTTDTYGVPQILISNFSGELDHPRAIYEGIPHLVREFLDTQKLIV